MKQILTLEQLRSEWINLHDLDRAKAVRVIHEAGPSIRQIAGQLHKPESSLRRLLVALDAPIEDRFLARKGRLTTTELVRRSRAAGRARAAKNNEELKLERERQTLHAADLICNWLAEKHMNGPNREKMVENVRLKLRGILPAELLPTIQAGPDTPIDQIIEQTKPPELKEEYGIDIAGWLAEWLYNWTFYAFRDEVVRDNALDLALARRSTRLI
jgi:hypothetical protein